MSRQNSITHKDFSNFLELGAFLRHGSDFYLILGPFKSSENQKNQEVSVFCPNFFAGENEAYLSGVGTFCISGAQIYQLCRDYLNQMTASGDLSKVSWSRQRREDFDISFARIQNLISQGQIEKAVPITMLKAKVKIGAAERAQMILNLVSAPEELYAYGFWDQESGIIGATPEILFIREDKKIKTMALAGTLAKDGKNQGENLLRDTKEIHEHRVVIEDIIQQLSPVGMVTTRGPELLDLPSLWHLKTDIQVELNEEVEFKKIIQRLHPTPALGCAPRLFGWRWMQELPGQADRARFGAPFGMVIDQSLQICLVAIRNMQWTQAEAKIFAGCGVVKESQADQEWFELDRKIQSIFSILGIQK